MLKIRLAFVMILALLLPGLTALAEQEADPSLSFTFDYTGVRFDMPEDWQSLEGSITEAEDYGVMRIATGIRIGYLKYRPVTQQQDDEMAEFIDSGDGEFTEEEMEAISSYYSQSIPLFYVIGVRDGQDLLEECNRLSGESVPITASVEIGRKDGYAYYVAVMEINEEVSDGILKDAPQEIWQEIEALQEDVIAHPEYFTLIDGISNDSDYVHEGQVISFETTDLNGEPVSSADLFAGGKVTLLSIWRTWCGICLDEFPELNELHERFAQMGGQVVTYCADIASDDDMEYARSLTDGFDFVKLAGNEYDIPYMGTPFAYFVDSEGRVLGYPVESRDMEQCVTRMEAYLNGETPETDAVPTPGETGQNAVYVIYVVDQHGDPVPDATVTFCTASSCNVAQGDENGNVVFEGAPAAYHVSVIDLPDGYAFDEANDIYTETRSGGKTLVVTRS